jgi:hypothetical protein
VNPRFCRRLATSALPSASEAAINTWAIGIMGCSLLSAKVFVSIAYKNNGITCIERGIGPSSGVTQKIMIKI